MTIEELEAADAAYREHLRRQAIDFEVRGLQRARERRGRTDAIERHLALLRKGLCRWHMDELDDARCDTPAVPGELLCADHLVDAPGRAS